MDVDNERKEMFKENIIKDTLKNISEKDWSSRSSWARDQSPSPSHPKIQKGKQFLDSRPSLKAYAVFKISGTSWGRA